MVYVERDPGTGFVKGLNYAGPAKRADGTPVTEPDPLPDNHPDVLAYLARAAVPPPKSDERALVNVLLNKGVATRAEIDADIGAELQVQQTKQP